MRVSLVLCTLGRTAELARFLASIDAQTHRDWEVIVVDQNLDDRARAVVASYEGRRPVVHVPSAPGLSRARNVALPRVTGHVVAFPDDDCWYAPGLLEHVADWFERHQEWHGLAGRAVDERGRATSGRWSRREGPISAYNCWWRGVSFSMFLRRAVVERVGPFDERLGVGAGTPWGSAEELDYMLRAIKRGCLLYYDPRVVVSHPNPISRYDRGALARARAYGMGIGRVLRKHEFPVWFMAYLCGRPLVGAALSLVAGKTAQARYYWSGFEGRVRGAWTGPD